MKRNILIFSFIILVLAVNVSGQFYGKGDCPDLFNPCRDSTTCEGGESCEEGYYCLFTDVAVCSYAGIGAETCTEVGGTWNWEENGCYKNLKFEGTCDSCNDFDSCALPSGEPYCFEGSYCTETGGQAYCAPPSFSQEHCTIAGGTWNGITELCIFPMSFNGKGDCPGQPGPCNSNTQCPNPGKEDCASGYYCKEVATIWGCQYAGLNNYCDIAGGTWDWGKNACIKTVGQDILLEGSCDSCNFGTCINTGMMFSCFEGSYCADSAGQAYCAPPDFSLKHCEEAGGTWDAINELCELPTGTCFDGIQNQDETGIDIGGVCTGDGTCHTTEDCATSPADCGTCCYVALKMWTDGASPDTPQVATGIPIFALIVADENCGARTVNVEVKDVATDATVLGPTPTDFVSFDEGGTELFIANSQVDTTLLPPGDYYYTAEPNVIEIDTGEPLNTKTENEITILNQCVAPNPADLDACTTSPFLDTNSPNYDINDPTLTPASPGLFPDVDCDGIPDCVDNWLGGEETTETVSYLNDQLIDCANAWDCANSPWSDCFESLFGYGQTRMVRECGVYTKSCCNPPAGGQLCPPPPSFKSCIEEEEFPVFNWFNVLMVSMMLISFYFFRTKRKF